MKAPTVTALLAMLCGPAFAGTWHTATIERVYVLSNADVILILDEDSSYCTSTNSPKRYRIAVNKNGVTAEGRDALYAAVLAAAAQGHRITFYFDESTPSCHINRLQVIHTG